jgi:hypothetical protein
MGNSQSIKVINFEDMQFCIKDENTLIINTLDEHNQGCLILGTLDIKKEIQILNNQLNKDRSVKIIIYGMNSTDNSPIKKYEQLIGLGFYNVYIYRGGLFEWLLLQDIYGKEHFKTTSSELDILKYKGHQIFNVKYLEG